MQFYPTGTGEGEKWESMESFYWGLLKHWIDLISSVEVLTFNRKQAAVPTQACPPADVKKWLKNIATSPNVQIKKCKNMEKKKSKLCMLFVPSI